MAGRCAAGKGRCRGTGQHQQHLTELRITIEMSANYKEKLKNASGSVSTVSETLSRTECPLCALHMLDMKAGRRRTAPVRGSEQDGSLEPASSRCGLRTTG